MSNKGGKKWVICSGKWFEQNNKNTQFRVYNRIASQIKHVLTKRCVLQMGELHVT